MLHGVCVFLFPAPPNCNVITREKATDRVDDVVNARHKATSFRKICMLNLNDMVLVCCRIRQRKAAVATVGVDKRIREGTELNELCAGLRKRDVP